MLMHHISLEKQRHYFSLRVQQQPLLHLGDYIYVGQKDRQTDRQQTAEIEVHIFRNIEVMFT